MPILAPPRITGRRGPWEIKYVPEAPGQSFKRGDWLMNSAGKAAIAAPVWNNVGNVTLYGMAAAPASGVTDTLVPVYWPLPGAEVLLPTYHTTESSAVQSLGDAANGAQYPLRNHGGVWCANKSAAGSNNRVTLVELYDPPGTVYGLNWWQPIRANLAWGT